MRTSSPLLWSKVRRLLHVWSWLCRCFETAANPHCSHALLMRLDSINGFEARVDDVPQHPVPTRCFEFQPECQVPQQYLYCISQ